MPAATYRIGELAARSGRSVHAIRWYESQGLIPGVVRDAAGRRVYSEQHLGWLDLMERLRRTGMSIAAMREYTRLVRRGRETLAQRREMLAAHRARVLRTLAEWNEALAIVDSKIDYYGEWIDRGERPKATPTQRRAAKPAAAPSQGEFPCPPSPPPAPALTTSSSPASSARRAPRCGAPGPTPSS